MVVKEITSGVFVGGFDGGDEPFRIGNAANHVNLFLFENRF